MAIKNAIETAIEGKKTILRANGKTAKAYGLHIVWELGVWQILFRRTIMERCWRDEAQGRFFCFPRVQSPDLEAFPTDSMRSSTDRSNAKR
ncbi:hypothetical protein ACUL41_01540 [Virgibacillus natechei]